MPTTNHAPHNLPQRVSAATSTAQSDASTPSPAFDAQRPESKHDGSATSMHHLTASSGSGDGQRSTMCGLRCKEPPTHTVVDPPRHQPLNVASQRGNLCISYPQP
mmetsp:Transcript_40404/g.94571  ORF Transcript_40404/g.94571 Transcript_40404/m.94571 type:complete len:105 (+) Transcript_40404:183-497(+)